MGQTQLPFFSKKTATFQQKIQVDKTDTTEPIYPNSQPDTDISDEDNKKNPQSSTDSSCGSKRKISEAEIVPFDEQPKKRVIDTSCSEELTEDLMVLDSPMRENESQNHEIADEQVAGAQPIENVYVEMQVIKQEAPKCDSVEPKAGKTSNGEIAVAEEEEKIIPKSSDDKYTFSKKLESMSDPTALSIVENEKTAIKSKKELEKLERQKKREIEKQLREEKKLKEQQEKEQRIREREEARKAKAMEIELAKETKKRKLEEEKIAREKKKEEDRLKKIAEKEEKEKSRLEKKRMAEEERKRAEEELARKQPKLNNFFSVEQKSKTEDDVKTDYEETFLPFYQKANCSVAFNGKLSIDELNEQKKLFDAGSSEDLNVFFSKQAVSKGFTPTVSSLNIVDSLNSNEKNETEIFGMLRKVPYKFLHFYENVRPPYSGTFSQTNNSLALLPFTKLAELDYSYDSDFQEDLEEDGEDIEDEELSDNENEEEDTDLDDFLDEDDRLNRRKVIGPLNPVIKWNTNIADPILEENHYERLNPQIIYPIDPFKNYWRPTAASRGNSPKKNMMSNTTLAASPKTDTVASNTPKRPKVLITDRKYLYELSTFISSNNDFTISTLVELAQKKFPGFTKLVIRNTIQEIAKRVGKSNDQKWEIDEALFNTLKSEFEIQL